MPPLNFLFFEKKGDHFTDKPPVNLTVDIWNWYFMTIGLNDTQHLEDFLPRHVWALEVVLDEGHGSRICLLSLLKDLSHVVEDQSLLPFDLIMGLEAH